MGREFSACPEPRGDQWGVVGWEPPLWQLWIVPQGVQAAFFTWIRKAVLLPDVWWGSGTLVISGMGLSFARWGAWAPSVAPLCPLLEVLDRSNRGGGAYSNHHVSGDRRKQSVHHLPRLPWPARPDASLLGPGGLTEYCAHRCCFLWTIWTSALTGRYMSLWWIKMGK